MTANAPSKDCPGCGHIVSPTWRVCPFCGTRLHAADRTLKATERTSKRDEVPFYIGPEEDIGRDQISTAWILVVLGALGMLAGTIILVTSKFNALFSSAGLLTIAVTVGGGALLLMVGSILAIATRGTSQPGEAPSHAQHQRNVSAAAATVGGVLSGLAVVAVSMLFGIVVGAIVIVASIIHLIQTCFESLQPK